MGHVVQIHRMAAAGIMNCRALPHQVGHSLNVQGGRHDYEAQVRSENRPALQAKRQSHIGSKRPLVKFVKNYASSGGQIRLLLQHAGEHPLSDDFNACVRTGAIFVAHAQAHSVPHIFAQ